MAIIIPKEASMIPRLMSSMLTRTRKAAGDPGHNPLLVLADHGDEKRFFLQR
jgi:hypothetical protein